MIEGFAIMSTEELIVKFKEDISWLEQGCATEQEIVKHIKEAVLKLESIKKGETTRLVDGWTCTTDLRSR